MPRNVRNFWIDVECDGYIKGVSAGPPSKEGGLTAEIYIRDKGSIKKAVNITGRREGDTLVLSIHCLAGEFIQIKTER